MEINTPNTPTFLRYLNLFLETVFPTHLPNFGSVGLTSFSINSENKKTNHCDLLYRFLHFANILTLLFYNLQNILPLTKEDNL